MPDKVIVCRDCRTEFIFSEGEQAFYQEKGFENDPVRCPDCRRLRKQQREQKGPQDRGPSAPRSYGSGW